MAKSTNIMTWVVAPNAGALSSAGGATTITAGINITQGWEAQMMVAAVYGATISFDTPVCIHRSTDGGANYASEPLFSFAIGSTVSVIRSMSFNLPTGQYSLRMYASSPTMTMQFLTYAVITAINIA